MASIKVNNITIQAQEGANLLETLLDNGIDVAHFCYHRALGKDGNCRMCLVHIEGKKRPQIACDTPVKDGMVVSTINENIKKVNKSILELELINHPIDCPTCDQAGECKLQDYYMDIGLYDSRFPKDEKVSKKKNLDFGNVLHDQERCVLCTRCVRFSKNITKKAELGVEGRGDHSAIVTFDGQPMKDPYSMNVVDLCPVGAMTSKDFQYKQRTWFLKSYDFICDGCSRGCNIYIDHTKQKYKDDIIYRYRPRENFKINSFFMCDEGRLSYHKENDNLLEKEKYDLSKIKELLTKKKTLILVGPNLSYEELEMAKKLSVKYKTFLSGYSPYTIDESFEDNFLRKADKSANRNSFKELSIDDTKECFEPYFKEAEVILVVQNETLESLNVNAKEIIFISAYKSELANKASMVIPILPFSQKDGTYINCDWIKQKVTSKLNKNKKANSFCDIVGELLK